MEVKIPRNRLWRIWIDVIENDLKHLRVQNSKGSEKIESYNDVGQIFNREVKAEEELDRRNRIASL